MTAKFEREGKTDYYLRIADVVRTRSTCLRRQYGAVIVKNDKIVATGYNGSARGEVNCCDKGECKREMLGIPSGERYELCCAVHAEANAIIQANRNDLEEAVIYISGLEVGSGKQANPRPCLMCARMIKNSGIKKVIGRLPDGGYLEYDVKSKPLSE